MKKVLNKLLPNIPHFPDQSLNEESLPYKIGSNITIKEYNKFLERQESSGYKYQRRDNGDVFIIDMSNPVHTSVASPSGNGQLIAADVTVYPNASHVQQPRIPYPGPPPGNINGCPHARIVCEVGNSQSTKEWNDKCQLWMNQIYIQYVLGIKLHKKRNRKNDLGQYHRSMTARLWQQGAGCQEWQFGTLIQKKQTPTTCNAPNLPQYQVIIPIAQVFWDPVLPLPLAVGYVPAVPNPLATAPVNFIIDLYRVQQLVLSTQNNA
nr:9779_t:CDS:2 [Entrophospora candida]